MKKLEYAIRMRETSEKVDSLVENALEPLKDVSETLHNVVFELPRKRIGTGFAVRPFLLRHSYEAAGGQDWKRIAPVSAAVELELCSMYYGNRIYDEKGGEKSKGVTAQQIMAAKITRDLATRVIEDLDCAPQQIEKVLHLMNESDLVFESGQFFDAFENVYSRKKDASFEEMIVSFRKRTYMINASYCEKIAKMGAILADSGAKEINALSVFGKKYGMLLQIVNDVADFVPSSDNTGTSEKIPEDSYSDVRHGKLTHPVIYTLHHGTDEERRKLIGIIERGMCAKEDELNELTRILIKNGAIHFAQQRAKQHVKKAKEALRIFDKEERRYLSTMCVIADTNRYYKALNKLDREGNEK